MQSKNILALLMFFVLLIAGCHNIRKDTERLKEINDFMYGKLNISVDANYQYVIFCPIKGCSDCIEPTIKLAKRILTSTSDRVLFVFSDFSTKDLRMHFNHKEIEKKNLILDGENQAYLAGLISTSPLFCTIKSGLVVEFKRITPENLEEISKIIDS